MFDELGIKTDNIINLTISEEWWGAPEEYRKFSE